MIDLASNDRAASRSDLVAAPIRPGDYVRCARRRPVLATAIALALCASVPGLASAQGDGSRTGAGSASEPLPDLVVRGQVQSLAEAARRKRDASNVVDITVADDIGRLPDRNIGDVLSRLPGVSTDQFEGEARFVNIRGLDASLNNLTLDGVQIATGDDRGRDGRSAALDGLSTSGVAAIEVVKTPTPDMDGTGVGGTINIITPSAFDRDDAFYGVSFDTSYSSVSDTSLLDWFNAEIFGSQLFGADRQFGVFASASYLRRDRLVRDRADSSNWVDFDGVELPERLDLTRFPIKRDRINVNLNFDYRATDATLLYLRTQFTNDERTITNRVNEQWRVRGAPEATAEGALAPLRITLDGWEREQQNRTWSFTLGGETDLVRDVQLDYSIAWARAVSDRPLWIQNRFRSSDFDGALFLEDRTRFEAVDPSVRQDPSIFRLQRVRFDSIDTRERILSPRLDLTWNSDVAGLETTLRTGVKATMRDKSVDARSDRYVPLDNLTLADNNFGRPGPGMPGHGFGGNWFQGAYTAGPAVNNRAVIDFFNANRDSFEFLEAQSIANNIEDDFDTDEDVYAGYLMAQFETDRALWTAGVRVEYTDYVSRASRVTLVDDELTGIDPVRGSRSYTDWLPNLQVRWSATDDIVVRAAYTESLGRPDFVAAAPIEEFEVEPFGFNEAGEQLFEGFLDAGNPELDRFQSRNWDFAVEYYPTATGMFAASLFYKDIKNPIFNQREFIDQTEFAGVALERLRVDSFQNAESGRVRGLELTAQEQFHFLPEPLSNFGASVNWTYVDSSSDVLEREDDLPFFGQADRIANAQLFYQQDGFESRLAWRYRRATLESLGGSPEQDIYRDGYRQIDLKASYRFSNGLRVSADVWNLTNEQPRIFQGRQERFWGLEDTGRIYTVGFQWVVE